MEAKYCLMGLRGRIHFWETSDVIVPAARKHMKVFDIGKSLPTCKDRQN